MVAMIDNYNIRRQWLMSQAMVMVLDYGDGGSLVVEVAGR